MTEYLLLLAQVRSSPVELSLSELEAMALRQTEEMAAQRQALQAREARLRYLKESQSRAGQMAAEQERLRRLRDRVEAQELKLSRLRALRGQVDHGKASSAALTSDLDSIRALFNEKEKELSMAVAKVEELTRQLEEVRRGRQTTGPPPLCHELDRLRRELLYRNKLNEQQTARLSEQRDILCQRQIEMASIDKRIAELQERLHRKRMLNQQLANQINAASNKASANQVNRSGSGGGGVQGRDTKLRSVQSGNIAAVEPYHHVPTYTSPTLSDQPEFLKQPEIVKSGYGGGGADIAKTVPATHHYVQETKGGGPPGGCGGGGAVEEGFGKADPKYQTLPYNTKFTGPGGGAGGKRTGAEGNETHDPSLLLEATNNNNLTILNNNNNSNSSNNNASQMNVPHHALGPPTIGTGGRKELLGKHPSASPTSSTSSYSSISHLGHRVYGNNLVNASLMARGQPVGGSTTSSTSSLASGSSAHSHHLQQHQLTTVTSTGSVQQSVTSRLTLPPTPLISDIQKPVNTVAPNSLHPLSNIYQSSSTKIHPVQPQTINPTSPQAPSWRDDLEKPALPPKPCVKPQPPPRQTHSTVEVGGAEPPPASIGLTVLTPPLRSIEDLSPNNNNTILSVNNNNNNNVSCPEQGGHQEERTLEEGVREEDVTDRGCPPEDSDLSDRDSLSIQGSDSSHRKGNLKGGVTGGEKSSLSRRVSFDPLALLLDASLEGELELVARTAGQVKDPSAANDEGITALHNAICAGHLDIVTFLVRFGCDVNAQDSDGWTPLHCAASCNNTTMVRFLVEHGACIFATTLSDHETAAEKCEEDEEGFDGCSEYLYSVQEKLGIMNGGVVYAVFEYEAHNTDELSFKEGDRLVVLRKGDEWERDWWWARLGDLEGYIPRNLLGLYPRVHPNKNQED